MADREEAPQSVPSDETERERLNRNTNELLQELRVSQTGVQILFAFLLTLPFTNRFSQVSEFERDVYFVSLLLAGAASALFIGPVSFHRLLFRRQEKRELVFLGNTMSIAGLACLAVAINGVILLITHFLLGETAAIITTACSGALFIYLWYAIPFARLRHARRRERERRSERDSVRS
jgi:O-antigen/teichoic acid export membrane protein